MHQRCFVFTAFVVAISVIGINQCRAEEKAAAYTGVVLRSSEKPPGVLVYVVAGGPASKSGLMAGDVITKIDGTQATVEVYLKTVGSSTPGDAVQLDIIRDGKAQRVVLTVGTRTKELEIATIELDLKMRRIEEKQLTATIKECEALEKEWQDKYDKEADKEKPDAVRLALYNANVMIYFATGQEAESELTRTQDAILADKNNLTALKGE